MSSEEGGRPQDQGRRHRSSGRLNAASRTLLERFRGSMRDELGAILDQLEGAAPAPGLMDPPGGAPKVRPPLSERSRLWELGIKLARELGEGIDPDPDPAPAEAERPARRRRARPEF